MANIKVDRVLELFLRGLRGEALSASRLAHEYEVSTRSISRDINSLKDFLADHRDLLGNARLDYSPVDHTYQLVLDEFLTSKELIAMVECLIGAKPFSKEELLLIINKLKRYTTTHDRERLQELINKEIYHYEEIKFECESVIENIFNMTHYIQEKKKITIEYIKMDHSKVSRTIIPMSIMFSDYYYYLIAALDQDEHYEPRYFRIDRITDITVHRGTYSIPREYEFDEGELRKKSQFMWPGQLQKVRFEFTGPSSQAILDKLPTAKIISIDNGVYTFEAEVYGDGIKMFLLSQGSWVKVLAPQEFVEEMKSEVEKMRRNYDRKEL